MGRGALHNARMDTKPTSSYRYMFRPSPQPIAQNHVFKSERPGHPQIMYRFKRWLTLTARLQIYHSFAQLHLDCANCRYRDGEIAGHSKSAISDCNFSQ